MIEVFFGRCLGGADDPEPLRLDGLNVRVPVDAGLIPGLASGSAGESPPSR